MYVIILCIIVIALITWFCIIHKEGFQFLGYPPFAGPGYFFNYPSRQYPPLTFEGYDIRGPPGCPNFGPCGEYRRMGRPGPYGEYRRMSRLGRPYYYDYWWPLPTFDYSSVYGANGKLRRF